MWSVPFEIGTWWLWNCCDFSCSFQSHRFPLITPMWNTKPVKRQCGEDTWRLLVWVLCRYDCDRGLYPSHPGAVLAAEMDPTKAQQWFSLSWEDLLRFRWFDCQLQRVQWAIFVSLAITFWMNGVPRFRVLLAHEHEDIAIAAFRSQEHRLSRSFLFRLQKRYNCQSTGISAAGRV